MDRSHPGIIDLFVDMVRHEYLLTQPLTKDDIRAEAARILSAFQAARGPNSPSGTHFMVQVSPDFLARANSKNQNRLVSMLPVNLHTGGAQRRLCPDYQRRGPRPIPAAAQALRAEKAE